MGGSASRTAGGLLGNVTGSESQTRGVSVEVGKTETAIDLKMGIEYGRNILQSVEEVRRRIAERVQSMTGLRVTELNVTIADIVFPEEEKRGRLGSGNGAGDRSLESADATNRPEARTLPRSELREGAAERETTEVEPRSRDLHRGRERASPRGRGPRGGPPARVGRDGRTAPGRHRLGATTIGRRGEASETGAGRRRAPSRKRASRKRKQRLGGEGAPRSGPGGAGRPKTTSTGRQGGRRPWPPTCSSQASSSSSAGTTLAEVGAYRLPLRPPR
jgi:uncharacterized alkaline shock family protein YloU